MAVSGRRLIIGGRGAALSSSDVFSVAALGFAVDLDVTAVEKLQRGKGRSGPKDSSRPSGKTDSSPQTGVSAAVLESATTSEISPGENLSREQARAALLVRLLEILATGATGGSPGASLAVYYSALLNNGVDLLLPAGPTDTPVLRAIQRAAAGVGHVGSWFKGWERGACNSEKLSVKLAEMELPPPPFSSPPAAWQVDSMAGTAGITALAVHLCSSLLTVSDSVAALSCEALQADVAPAIEPEHLENLCAHKSRLDVAADLRSLLLGSKCINPRKGGLTLKSVLAVPHCHGALREAVKTAATAVRVELNPGSESGGVVGEGSKAGSGAGRGPPFVPSFIVAGAAATMLRCLGPLASCSVKRTTKMVSLLAAAEAGLGEGGLERPRGWVQEMLGLLAVSAASVDAIKSAAAVIAKSMALGDFGSDEDDDEGLEGYEEGEKCGNGAVEKGTGENGQNGPPLMPTSRAVARYSIANLDSVKMSQGVPGVAAAGAACEAVDKARDVFALEAVVARQLIRLREAAAGSALGGQGTSLKGIGPAAAAESEAGREKGGGARRAKGGGAPALGKGSALVVAFLDEVMGAVGGGTAGGAASWSPEDGHAAVVAGLDPRGQAVGRLERAVRGAIESNEARRAPKIPKGTRDFLPDQMAIRERAFGIITGVFKRHGAVALDTPVFELRETLMGKYGEDSKLIYDLADQGGEILSLRYDLTVPFARYLAMHSVGNIKRYHIARVYRRDNPQMARGRYREFYQCDFDIAGQYAPMVPDAEVLKVLTELLEELQIGEYEVKLNHRRLLDGMLDICGVPSSKFRAICSAVDKLDKEPWEAVRTEMIEEKGLSPAVADRIGEFVVRKGQPLELLAELRSPGSPFEGHVESRAALEELALLFDYLAAMGALHRIVFDLSLARGLDYYTGVIYEAVFCGGTQVGSIAAGGRYDNLVGMFSGKQVPAVGVSLGIERVLTIMEEKERSKNEMIRATQTDVLVASIGPDLLRARMEVAAELWAAGVKAEFVMAASPNMQRQLEFANKAGIPWMVLFGSSEVEKGSVKVKDLVNRTEEEVERARLVEVMKQKLQNVAS